MIIDLILDIKDEGGVWDNAKGRMVAYTPEAFYRAVMEYGEIGHGIASALDGGSNEDVQEAIIAYLSDEFNFPGGPNEELVNWVRSEDWLEGAVEASIKADNSFGTEAPEVLQDVIEELESIAKTYTSDTFREYSVEFDYLGNQVEIYVEKDRAGARYDERLADAYGVLLNINERVHMSSTAFSLEQIPLVAMELIEENLVPGNLNAGIAEVKKDTENKMPVEAKEPKKVKAGVGAGFTVTLKLDDVGIPSLSNIQAGGNKKMWSGNDNYLYTADIAVSASGEVKVEHSYWGGEADGVPVTIRKIEFMMEQPIEKVNLDELMDAIAEGLVDSYSETFSEGWIWGGMKKAAKMETENGFMQTVSNIAYKENDESETAEKYSQVGVWVNSIDVEFEDRMVEWVEDLHNEQDGTYEVRSQDQEPIGDAFDSEEEAIEFAKANDGYYVHHNFWKTDYEGNTEFVDDELVWSRDDGDVESSYKLNPKTGIGEQDGKVMGSAEQYIVFNRDGNVMLDKVGYEEAERFAQKHRWDGGKKHTYGFADEIRQGTVSNPGAVLWKAGKPLDVKEASKKAGNSYNVTKSTKVGVGVKDGFISGRPYYLTDVEYNEEGGSGTSSIIGPKYRKGERKTHPSGFGFGSREDNLKHITDEKGKGNLRSGLDLDKEGKGGKGFIGTLAKKASADKEKDEALRNLNRVVELVVFNEDGDIDNTGVEFDNFMTWFEKNPEPSLQNAVTGLENTLNKIWDSGEVSDNYAQRVERDADKIVKFYRKGVKANVAPVEIDEDAMVDVVTDIGRAIDHSLDFAEVQDNAYPEGIVDVIYTARAVIGDEDNGYDISAELVLTAYKDGYRMDVYAESGSVIFMRGANTLDNVRAMQDEIVKLVNAYFWEDESVEASVKAGRWDNSPRAKFKLVNSKNSSQTDPRMLPSVEVEVTLSPAGGYQEFGDTVSTVYIGGKMFYTNRGFIEVGGDSETNGSNDIIGDPDEIDWETLHDAVQGRSDLTIDLGTGKVFRMGIKANADKDAMTKKVEDFLSKAYKGTDKADSKTQRAIVIKKIKEGNLTEAEKELAIRKTY